MMLPVQRNGKGFMTGLEDGIEPRLSSDELRLQWILKDPMVHHFQASDLANTIVYH